MQLSNSLTHKIPPVLPVASLMLWGLGKKPVARSGCAPTASPKGWGQGNSKKPTAAFNFQLSTRNVICTFTFQSVELIPILLPIYEAHPCHSV